MTIICAVDTHQEFLRALWQEEWGGLTMITRGTSHHLDALSALVAEEDGVPVGAITWAMRPGEAEIVSLNALYERRGIGSALLRGAEEYLASCNISRLVLVTTNDNLNALAFYQKRGYRLESIDVGAVDRARREKPAIPLTGSGGIEIHDELVLAKLLHRQR
jgi:GNAT superfamily N-acetyltransferase